MAKSVGENVMITDLHVGQYFQTQHASMTLDDIVTFARAYDPQPMHMDPVAAEGFMFGNIIASGWHVLAITMRLIVDMRPFGSTPLLGAEITRIRFCRPVFPGTDILARLTIRQIEPPSGSGRTYAYLDVNTVDAASDKVLVSQEWKLVLPICD